MSEFKELKLSDIFPSRTNPRSEFEENSIRELSESIKQHGVLQPIIVREQVDRDNKYDLVCGERRYRASILAELETIPALIRELTDNEVLEIQVLENLQREDVSPMDEAKAFKTLLGKEDLEWLSSKINKSKKYVLNRIKLLELAEEIQEDLTSGKLPLGHAVVLVRLPKEEQLKLYGYAVNGESLSTFKSRVSRNYLGFDKAVFDINDETLLPKVGSCQNCAKRTINNQLLFEDVTSEDRCTDEICFNAKIENHFSKLRKQAYEKFDNIKQARTSYDGIYLNEFSYKFSEEQTEEFPNPIYIEQDNYPWRHDSSLEGKVVFINLKEKEEKENIQQRDYKAERIQNTVNEFENIINPRLKILEKIKLEELDGSEFSKIIAEEYLYGTSALLLFLLSKKLGYKGGKTKELDNLSINELIEKFDSLNWDTKDEISKELALVISSRYSLEQCIVFREMLDLIDEETSEDEEPEFSTKNKNWEGLVELLGVESTENENSQTLSEALDELLNENKPDVELPTFEKITRKKKFALTNSYFKNHNPQTEPGTPFEVYSYYKQHGELPFDADPETAPNWLYETYIEYQKRAGVYNSQFFTPPATAERIAELADKYFRTDERETCRVLDACCGFGMLTKPLTEKGFIVKGFDNNSEILKMYSEYTGCISEQKDIHSYLAEDTQWMNIVSNPPYEIKELTQFLKLLWDLLKHGGLAVLLLPKGFVDKDKPKALVEVLEKFSVMHREDMQEDFARTGMKAEIVVLEKN